MYMYVNQSEETSLPQNNFIGYSKRMKGAAVPDALGERERERDYCGIKKKVGRSAAVGAKSEISKNFEFFKLLDEVPGAFSAQAGRPVPHLLLRSTETSRPRIGVPYPQ